MEESSECLEEKANLLQALISPLSSSISKLSGRSRTIPSGKDFHFFNNFDEFKLPAKEIAEKSDSSLRSLSSGALFGSKSPPALPSDLDDAYDWLVNLNDEIMERFGVSLDEFKRLREKEEEKGEKIGSLALLEEGGFQLVYGKKNKKKNGDLMEDSRKDEGSMGVKVALRDKRAIGARPKVPFHIPSIRRPQDEFNILVNNNNAPFEHVWLERSEDESRFIHPLEKLSASDFVDRSVDESSTVEPLPLESTPFKLVEGVKQLKDLAAKLQGVNEFAVDLEHNQYRSFQGLTCLMQISTRTEDFIIDTLKLRVHVGPYLREVFKDPTKRKVMHGADRDIEWLQRDFGIYVCNLFDTGQASRVMQLERNSLEHLLHHFCGVNANKEYQNADWRLRPLPDEMLKYGREDTHYLLYIYDLMRHKLLSESSDESDLLLEVYKRSYDVCIHLYKKELLTDTSFLHIYGLQEADFDSKQLAVVAGLYAWRDQVAREEDESTGYILPNKALLEIAREMPLSSGKLRRLVKSKHSIVERHLKTVINVIRHSIENSSAFESIAEQLKKARLESHTQNTEESVDNPEAVPANDPLDSAIDQRDGHNVASNTSIIMQRSENVAAVMDDRDGHVKPTDTKNISGQIISPDRIQEEEKSYMSENGGLLRKFGMSGTTITEKDDGTIGSSQATQKVSVSSVQIQKKQSCAFGALLGNSSSRRKLNSDKDKNVTKVEQIKSSVTLPFLSFSGGFTCSEPSPAESNQPFLTETSHQDPNLPSEASQLEELIPLEIDEKDSTQSPPESPAANDGPKHREWFPHHPENNGGDGPQPETEAEEEPMSLSELSSSFQQCFQSINQGKSSPKKKKKQYQDPEPTFQVKPFDYAAARKNVKFGSRREEVPEDRLNTKGPPDFRDKRRGSAAGQANGEERVKGIRRHAFPPTGNRTATYK